MTKKCVIGINGKINSGKDTAAKYLADVLDGKIFHFATPVKEIVNAAFNVPLDWMEDRTLKESNFKGSNDITLNVRDLMRFVGQSFKEKDPDVWVNICRKKINCFYYENKDSYKHKVMYFIIPDLRFANEAKICDYTINVTRDVAMNNDTSITENSLNDFKFDYTVTNNGKMEDFFIELYKISNDIESTFLEK